MHVFIYFSEPLGPRHLLRNREHFNILHTLYFHRSRVIVQFSIFELFPSTPVRETGAEYHFFSGGDNLKLSYL